jgi:hypothetical protein
MQDPTLTVREAVDQYLEENRFSRDEYTRKTVPLKVGPWTFQFPNGPARQRAIPLHDMHHAITGYGTDLIGEAEIGAWELRAGCTNAFLYAINLMAVLGGLWLSPRRVLRAWRSGRGARTLYATGLSADELDRMTLDEVRSLARVPAGGVSDPATRKLAWA